MAEVLHDEVEQGNGPENLAHPASGDGVDRWWETGRFHGWPSRLRSMQNDLYDESCQTYADVMTARHDSLSPDLLLAMRSDVIVATRWSARRDSILRTAQLVSDWTDGTAVLSPMIVTAVLITELPAWFIWTTIVVSFFFLIPEQFLRQNWADVAIILLLILLVVIVLLPFDGIDILWRLLALVVTQVLASGFRFFSSKLLAFNVSYPWIFSIALVNAVVLLVSLMSVEGVGVQFGLPWQIVMGIKVGLIGGACLGLWSTAVEAINQVSYQIIERKKFRAIPEEEFVQSAVWLISGTDYASPDADWTRADQRREVVWRLQWLVDLLDDHIPRRLAKLDPRNRAVINDAFKGRAAVLDEWRRSLLLGGDLTRTRLIDEVWNLAVVGADRRWQQLRETDVTATPRERPARQVWIVAKKLLLLAVPLAALVWGIVSDQSTTTLAAAAITAFLLLDFVNPGSGSKIADAVNQASTIIPGVRLPGR